MNFFEQQDRARNKTALLVILFFLAVVSLIFVSCLFIAGVFAYIEPNDSALVSAKSISFFEMISRLSIDTYIGIALVIFSVVVVASLFKMSQMSAGGEAVANALGGRLININTRNAEEKKLLNVVEEMAIASGVPVPPVYLLDEKGINAFAAGTRPQNAAIGITQGAIEQLNRDELQGVIAHEFSHIFNGDMRLNMRLIGLLYGIMVLGTVGYYLLRMSSRGAVYRSRSNNNALPFVVLGVGLMVIGYAGTFFGNLIKSAVSRQREYLADASAVQFTRNADGIGSALKAIAGYSEGSKIHHPGSSEVSHLFFGQAVSFFFNGLFATHPPIDERIRRIDKGWQAPEEHSASIDNQPTSGSSHFTNTIDDVAVSHLSSTTASNEMKSQIGHELLTPEILASKLTGYTGEPSKQQREYARNLLTDIPASVKEAAHEPYGARALVYFLLLDPNQIIRDKQLDILSKQADSIVFAMVMSLQGDLDNEDILSLAVLDVALPALKQLSALQKKEFNKVLLALIEADKQVDFYEWSLHALVQSYLGMNRFNWSRSHVSNIKLLGKPLCIVLSVLAYAGFEPRLVEKKASESSNFPDPQQDKLIKESFFKAAGILGMQHAKLLPRELINVRQFEKALRQLGRVQPLQKPRILKALAFAASSDGVVQPLEVQLVRAIAQYLDCPAPVFPV